MECELAQHNYVQKPWFKLRDLSDPSTIKHSSLCNVMPCNTYLFCGPCTKSQHITKVESDIRKIDNRCCYRRESELTVQTRNTCYQLQKIVLVFFFFLFRIILLFVLWQFITLRYQISFQISTGSHVKIARRTATKADAKPQHESLLES